jgi:hypothetical protein
MRIVTACFCGLILWALPSRLVCAEGEAELRFNWQAGKRYTMSLATSNQMVMEVAMDNVPPIPQKAVADEKREFTISVLKASPKEGYELVVEGLSTKLEHNGGAKHNTYSFDTTTDPKKDVGVPLAAWNRAFIGTKIKYQVDSDFKVLHVEGKEELVGKAMAHGPALKKDTGTPLLIESQYGTNALVDLLQKLMVVGLPKNSLKVGDQWTYSREDKRERSVVESKFTFAGLENHLGRHCARIGIEAQIKSSSDQGMLAPGIPYPKVHGQVKGDLWLDMKIEMVVERTLVEETETAMDMPLEVGGTAPMKINQRKTVTCKLIKVEDN